MLLLEGLTVTEVPDPGHRLTLIVQTPDGTKYVAKVTDTNHQDYEASYGTDTALVTYKQGALDVATYGQIRESFKETYEEYAEQLVFPTTRLVIVYVKDFLKILPEDIKHRHSPMLRLFREAVESEPDSKPLMFMVMQEYVPFLTSLKKEDYLKNADLILILSNWLKDVVAKTGQNLLVNPEGKIVILDIELDQVDWAARIVSGALKVDRPLLLEMLQPFEGLRYEKLNKEDTLKLKKSLSDGSYSTDSGAFSSGAFSEESLELDNLPENDDVDDDDNDNVFYMDYEKP